MNRQTILSSDRVYRYVLWREWNPSSPRFAMFIGLNPSTADETIDDPTIRRCVGFAKAWGYGALCMTNLFAFRATQPRAMMGCPKPIGDENDKWLVECAREAAVIVAAWGTKGGFAGRDQEVFKLLDGLMCLGVTKDGFPRHPLYVHGATQLIDYNTRQGVLV